MASATSLTARDTWFTAVGTAIGTGSVVTTTL